MSLFWQLNRGRVVAVINEDGVGQCRIGTRTSQGVTWLRAFDATAPQLPGFEQEKVFEF